MSKHQQTMFVPIGFTDSSFNDQQNDFKMYSYLKHECDTLNGYFNVPNGIVNHTGSSFDIPLSSKPVMSVSSSASVYVENDASSRLKQNFLKHHCVGHENLDFNDEHELRRVSSEAFLNEKFLTLDDMVNKLVDDLEVPTSCFKTSGSLVLFDTSGQHSDTTSNSCEADWAVSSSHDPSFNNSIMSGMWSALTKDFRSSSCDVVGVQSAAPFCTLPTSLYSYGEYNGLSSCVMQHQHNDICVDSGLGSDTAASPDAFEADSALMNWRDGVDQSITDQAGDRQIANKFPSYVTFCRNHRPKIDSTSSDSDDMTYDLSGVGVFPCFSTCTTNTTVNGDGRDGIFRQISVNTSNFHAAFSSCHSESAADIQRRYYQSGESFYSDRQLQPQTHQCHQAYPMSSHDVHGYRYDCAPKNDYCRSSDKSRSGFRHLSQFKTVSQCHAQKLLGQTAVSSANIALGLLQPQKPQCHQLQQQKQQGLKNDEQLNAMLEDPITIYNRCINWSSRIDTGNSDDFVQSSQHRNCQRPSTHCDKANSHFSLFPSTSHLVPTPNYISNCRIGNILPASVSYEDVPCSEIDENTGGWCSSSRNDSVNAEWSYSSKPNFSMHRGVEHPGIDRFSCSFQPCMPACDITVQSAPIVDHKSVMTDATPHFSARYANEASFCPMKSTNTHGYCGIGRKSVYHTDACKVERKVSPSQLVYSGAQCGSSGMCLPAPNGHWLIKQPLNVKEQTQYMLRQQPNLQALSQNPTLSYYAQDVPLHQLNKVHDMQRYYSINNVPIFPVPMPHVPHHVSRPVNGSRLFSGSTLQPNVLNCLPVCNSRPGFALLPRNDVHGIIRANSFDFRPSQGRHLPARIGHCNEQHCNLEDCYEQFRMIEKERRKMEAEFARQNPGKRVSSANNVVIPRMSSNPTEVDRLVVDSFAEHARMMTLLDKMEKLRHITVHASIQSCFDTWLEGIRKLQARRKEQIINAVNRHHSGFLRQQESKDMAALTASLRELTSLTRRARTASWCALQMAHKENTRLSSRLQLEDLVDLLPYTYPSAEESSTSGKAF